MQTPAHILLKLLSYQPPSPPPSSPIYISFSLLSSSASSSLNPSYCTPFLSPSSSSSLSQQLLLPVPDNFVPVLVVKKWENGLVFQLEIEIQEIRVGRNFVRNVDFWGIGTIMGIGLAKGDIRVIDNYVHGAIMHYMIIQSVQPVDPISNNTSQFTLKTQTNSQTYPIAPLSSILIKIPQKFQLFQTLYPSPAPGSPISKSKLLTTQSISPSSIIEMQAITPIKQVVDNVKLKVKWVINLMESKMGNMLLVDAQEICIYDVELKFQNAAQFGNSKVRVQYGTKGFQLGNDFNSSKPAKIRKIIHFTTKSQDEQIYIIIQKSPKVTIYQKFHLQQIPSLTPFSFKKKLTDHGKQIGMIKFKCEKSASLSTPSNNKIWQQFLNPSINMNLNGLFAGIKKGSIGIGTIVYVFEQLSVRYQQNGQDDGTQGTQSRGKIRLSVKGESQEEVQVRDLGNKQQRNMCDRNVRIAIGVKGDDSLYMVLKQDQGSDFIGIALFNPLPCRLGQSCQQLHFFKNQNHTITLNFILHKLPSYPFLKPNFCPQPLISSSSPSLNISLSIRQIYFTAYFHTYQYDNKNQVYSIVSIAHQKKVLILQKKSSPTSQLLFTCSASSDNLDFTIENSQFIRIKITFLVSDIGQDQEIYGVSIVRVKGKELESSEAGLKFFLVEIKNEYGVGVGQVNLQVHKAALFNSYQKQSRDILQSGNKGIQGDKRRLKMQMVQISQSMQMHSDKNPQFFKNKLKSVSLKKQANQTPKPSVRYPNTKPAISLSGERKKRNHSVMGVEQSIKLPSIRQQSASPRDRKSYNQLVHMLKIRKRSMKGHYQQNSMLESYQMRSFQNQISQKQQIPFSLPLKQKIQKQNPNLSRNMEILFPKKSPNIQRNVSNRRPIPPSVLLNQEEQNLKGLKSVYNQISQDMGDIEPTVRDHGGKNFVAKEKEKETKQKKEEEYQMDGPQWEGNQFAV